MFTFLSLSLQRIESKNWLASREYVVYEYGAIPVNIRHIANPLC